MTETDFEIAGHAGRIVGRRWAGDDPRYVAVVVHGHAEHSGRYRQLAGRLVADGAVVYAADHAGHGRSDGERVSVPDMDRPASDLRGVLRLARGASGPLPVVVVAHSMGAIVATRCLQLFDDDVRALVLSGPAIGGNPAMTDQLAVDPLPRLILDPVLLSRDPGAQAEYARDELVHHGPFRRETLEGWLRSTEAIARDGGVGDLPVLWLHGDADRVTPADIAGPAVERIAGHGLRRHRYPGARHQVFHETNRDEVMDDAGRFLREVLGL